jgi:hypothetical protein
MIWSLVSDAVVAVLLIVTIAYAIRLNNRLANLRADRDRLIEMIAGLQQATTAAEEAVRGLKLSAAETGQDLQAALDRADAMRKDLAFLLERGELTASRLEAAGKPRAAEPAPQRPPPPGPSPDPRARREPTLDPARIVEPPPGPSRSERELQRLLEGRR